MEGLAGAKENQLRIQKSAYRFNFSPGIERFLELFKVFGLVLLRDVDRVGESDMDIVGMEEVRNSRHVLLFVRPGEVADELDLLFSHR